MAENLVWIWLQSVREHARARSFNFDARRFVSVAIAKRFEESIVKRSSIPERGFELAPGNFSYFNQIIATRKWEQFSKPQTGHYQWSGSFMPMPMSTLNSRRGLMGRNFF